MSDSDLTGSRLGCLKTHGVVFVRDRIVSIAHIEQALRSMYRIQVLEETHKGVRCKLIRNLRLVGSPWLGPHTTLSVVLDKRDDGTILQYEFQSPEYYIGLGVATLIGICTSALSGSSSSLSRALNGLMAFGIGFMFFSLLIYLDSVYVSWRIRRLLKGFQGDALK